MKSKKKVFLVVGAVLLANSTNLNYDAAEAIKQDKVSDEYKVSYGIDFELKYTSSIDVPLGTEITKEFLKDEGYVNYLGEVTATSNQLSDGFFVGNDEYSKIDLGDYDPTKAGEYDVSITFVDAQDSHALYDTTVDFKVNVIDESIEEPDVITPSLPGPKQDGFTDNYNVETGLDFSLRYTTEFDVNVGQELTKQYLYDNQLVKYEGVAKPSGSQLSDKFFVNNDEYSYLSVGGYNPNEVGDYPVRLYFVDSESSTNTNWSYAEFTVHVV